MEKVKISVEKTVIPTYRQPEPEEMPMFAENRVHQRTSGRPYPNKVVMQVDRTGKYDKEYTVVRLENEYIRVEILPEIGGRIYSALDKTTGYDFFYKQHVIKPALIGVLGSWISGGVEFNWPFHHRASGFMPCDYYTEELPDGSAVCRLSEHDPIDRMKGEVSIILRPGTSFLETRMRLYNRTPVRRSFLWWENAAVPVNEQYRIFFPQDVTYVSFHYHKSRAHFPVAGSCVYNGIKMDTDRDISFHKNTRQATSYFAAPSDYDFFGGYDCGKKCGVVHVGDHHVSPGKKMFTWAYGQLSRSWEKALTDEDGQYAELMAGSYSENQPDFSWLEPYETKEFSQFWYPISEIGTPTFANLDCAINIDRENGEIKILPTRRINGARISVSENGIVLSETTADLSPDKCTSVKLDRLLPYVTVCVEADGKRIAGYTEREYDRYNMPECITDMPEAAKMTSVDELYLAGVHVDQYRDPAVEPDAYYKEALKRDPRHVPSLTAMAEYEFKRYDLDAAEKYAVQAIKVLRTFNARTESGRTYYVYAQILEASGNTDKAYDYYRKAALSQDCTARALTRAAMTDIKRGDFETAVKNAETALDFGRKNCLAAVAEIIASRETGSVRRADELIASYLEADPLDHTMRFLSGEKDLYKKMDSDAVQTCLDIAFDLYYMGRYADAVRLLEGLEKERGSLNVCGYYALGYFKKLCGLKNTAEYEKAGAAKLGNTYPWRLEEIAVLREAINNGCTEAKMLLGCLLYNKRHYTEAARLWEECDDKISRRNLAAAYFSHLARPDDALCIMTELHDEYPDNDEILYETAVLMSKTGTDPSRIIELLTEKELSRDDIITELAKAYNRAFMPDEALRVLMSHGFVPCEGGEHAIADQYMFAYLVKGRMALDSGDITGALGFFRKGKELPDQLGAGIWNICKLVPLEYHEAVSLALLGQKGEAEALFEKIVGTEVDYFSNMHLKGLPYYKALALRRLGRNTEATRTVTEFYKTVCAITDVTDNGFFGTTPFFISFVDEPKKLRRAQYLFLMALCGSLMKKPDAADGLSESVLLNGDNLFGSFYLKFGFAE